MKGDHGWYNTLKTCEEKARQLNHKYYAIQADHYCFTDNTYGGQGKATECGPCKKTGEKDRICGGGWANAVYEVKECGSIKQKYMYDLLE